MSRVGRYLENKSTDLLQKSVVELAGLIAKFEKGEKFSAGDLRMSVFYLINLKNLILKEIQLRSSMSLSEKSKDYEKDLLREKIQDLMYDLEPANLDKDSDYSKGRFAAYTEVLNTIDTYDQASNVSFKDFMFKHVSEKLLETDTMYARQPSEKTKGMVAALREMQGVVTII